MGTDDSQEVPWGSLSSAGVMLMTMPVALGVMQLLCHDEFTNAGVAQMIAEGGPWSFVVLGAGLAASIASAVSAHAAPRNRALPFALAAFFLPFLIAIVGTLSGIRGLIAAVSGHSTHDRALIVVLGVGEVATLEALAAVIGAAGCVMVAVSALLVSRFFAGLATAAVMLLLAAGLTARADLVVGFQRALRTVSHTTPTPFSTRLIAHGVEIEPARLVANVCVFAAIACAACSVAVMRWRGVRLNGGVLAGLVLAPVAASGLILVCERLLVNAVRAEASGPSMFIALDGRRARYKFATLDAFTKDTELRVQRARDDSGVGIALEFRLDRALLVRGLQSAQALKAEVALIGAASVRGSVPLLFRAAADVANDDRREVPLMVLGPDEVCSRCIGDASLFATGLQVRAADGVRQWPPALSDFSGSTALPVVSFEWTTSPADLARAAGIAFGHGHVLAVRVPTPDPPLNFSGGPSE